VGRLLTPNFEAASTDGFLFCGDGVATLDYIVLAVLIAGLGAAIAAGFWFLWVRCPACRTINAVDLHTLDRHPDAAVSSLTPGLSCCSCRPNAPFAELVRLSRTSIADEMREELRRRALGDYRKVSEP
jgi:hypothetical protein